MKGWTAVAHWCLCGAAIIFGLRLNGAYAAQTVTLNDAIGIALERNVALLQALTAAELSDVDVSEARLRFAPNLSINTSGSNTFGRYLSSVTGSYVDQTTKALTANASSGVNLFAGFHDVAALRQAKLNRLASQLDLGRAQETAVFTVISNFLTLILQQDQLRVQRENLAAEAKLEEQIRDYVASGVRASADLYQQQANVASARLGVIQAQNAAETSKLDLLRTLQLDPLESYEFQAPTTDSLYADDSGDLQDLVARALDRREDLHAEEARVGALEQSVRVAGSTYWPTVSVGAGYGSSYTSALSSDFRDQLDTYRSGSVSVNVTVPLFDRGTTRSAVRRARLQVQNERIVLDSERHEVELQVKTVYLDYHAAREELAAAESEQHTAQLAVEAAQERFKAGTAILVEVSQERSRYEVAESALVTARYNLALQSTLMKYYLGQIHGAENVPPPKAPAKG